MKRFLTEMESGISIVVTTLRFTRSRIWKGTIWHKRSGQPYLSIYACLKKGYLKQRDDVFLHKEPVVVTSLRREYDNEGNSDPVYVIQLKHGSFTWTIRKSHLEFRYLAKHLPSGRAGRNSKVGRILKANDLPKCPSKSENKLVTENDITKRIRKLEVFIKEVLKDDTYSNNIKTIEFLETSRLSFINDLGEKYKEGIVLKNAVDNPLTWAVHTVHAAVLPHSLKRWLILKDTFVALLRTDDDSIRDVILMDNAFQVCKNMPDESKKAIKISNLNRELVIECLTEACAVNWFNEINEITKNAQDFVQPNRLDSFAPMRNDIYSKWFVDGCDYFEAVADGLEAAQEEIFITDWMLSPELYMKRKNVLDKDKEFWRLDNILERKAKQGIHIFVLIFREVEFALGLKSEYTKQRLKYLHPENIKILRHRGFTNVMVWTPHDKMVIIDQKYAFLGGIDLCFGRWDDHTHRLVDLGDISDRNAALKTMSSIPIGSALDNEARKGLNHEHLHHFRWPGKDYMNFIHKDFQNVDSPFEDLIDRQQVQRMPWHDVGVFIQDAPARDLARHFIQRWNFAKVFSHKDDTFYPLLMPKSYRGFCDSPKLFPKSSLVNCQVLRSASDWSAGLKQHERSIQTAYLKIINEAKHFIYIENQFFVSLTKKGQSSTVLNEIADTIYRRIVRAHKAGENFRVYVVMPLLPGIEGDITSDETGGAIRAVTHWNYQSICRGPNSLFTRLQSEVGDPNNYLSFCALRTFDKMEYEDGSCPKPVTELVYVHSKVIIADDRVAIIGSANINDRSMNGNRDSEVAVLLEDLNFEEMSEDQTFPIGKFVGSLRLHIFREHLGMLDCAVPQKNMFDPSCDEFYKEIWLKIASKNTQIFDEVFHCIPNDSIIKFAHIEDYKKKERLCDSDPQKALSKLESIQGHLVLMPMFFLCDENLAPALNTKEGVIPTSLFT